MKRTKSKLLTKDELKSIIKMIPEVNINTQIAFVAQGAVCIQAPRIIEDESGFHFDIELIDFISVPDTNLMAAYVPQNSLYLWRIEEV